LMTTERGSMDGDHGREKTGLTASGVNVGKSVFSSRLRLHPETRIPVDESHQLWRADDKSQGREAHTITQRLTRETDCSIPVASWPCQPSMALPFSHPPNRVDMTRPYRPATHTTKRGSAQSVSLRSAEQITTEPPVLTFQKGEKKKLGGGGGRTVNSSAQGVKAE